MQPVHSGMQNQGMSSAYNPAAYPYNQPAPSMTYDPSQSSQMYNPYPYTPSQPQQPDQNQDYRQQPYSLGPSGQHGVDYSHQRSHPEQQQPQIMPMQYPQQDPPYGAGMQGMPPSPPVPQFQPKHGAPPVAAPAPNVFMPSVSPSPVQAPGINQPMSPPKAKTPPTPKGPPADISINTADTSQVPPDQKQVIAALTNLFKQCETAARVPAKQKEMADNSKRLGALFWKMNKREVSPAVMEKLVQLALVLQQGDLVVASQIQNQLSDTAWEEGEMWLPALKRLLKAKQMMQPSMGGGLR